MFEWECIGFRLDDKGVRSATSGIAAPFRRIDAMFRPPAYARGLRILPSVTEISVYEFRSTTCGQTTHIPLQAALLTIIGMKTLWLRYTCNSHDLFSFSGGETPTKLLFSASPESSLIRFC